LLLERSHRLDVRSVDLRQRIRRGQRVHKAAVSRNPSSAQAPRVVDKKRRREHAGWPHQVLELVVVLRDEAQRAVRLLPLLEQQDGLHPRLVDAVRGRKLCHRPCFWARAVLGVHLLLHLDARKKDTAVMAVQSLFSLGQSRSSAVTQRTSVQDS